MVSGTDRAGDKWVITVHGPGQVIVTDTTPNDGALDDDINTIQLVNTKRQEDLCHRQRDPVESRADQRAKSSSTSSSRSRGVKSIELNGFDLSAAGHAGGDDADRRVPLWRSGHALVQRDRYARSTPRSTPLRSRCVIGLPNTPLKQQPSIFLNNITNLVFDSTSTTIPTDAADHAFGAVHDQWRGAKLRHRLGHAGHDSGRIPVRVPAGRHDRANGHPGDGDQ